MIACHFDAEKPEWMDGGAQQDEMAEALKLEVKQKAHRRRSVRILSGSERVSPAETTNGDCIMLPPGIPPSVASPMRELVIDGAENYPQSLMGTGESGSNCTLAGKGMARQRSAIGRSDAILVMFYLENLFPFLFPYYRPPLLQGGRTWILEMMISSPVVKQALLCQSSYYFSLAQGMPDWDKVLAQTRDAFRGAEIIVTGHQ